MKEKHQKKTFERDSVFQNTEASKKDKKRDKTN